MRKSGMEKEIAKEKEKGVDAGTKYAGTGAAAGCKNEGVKEKGGGEGQEGASSSLLSSTSSSKDEDGIDRQEKEATAQPPQPQPQPHHRPRSVSSPPHTTSSTTTTNPTRHQTPVPSPPPSRPSSPAQPPSPTPNPPTGPAFGGWAHYKLPLDSHPPLDAYAFTRWRHKTFLTDTGAAYQAQGVAGKTAFSIYAEFVGLRDRVLRAYEAVLGRPVEALRVEDELQMLRPVDYFRILGFGDARLVEECRRDVRVKGGCIELEVGELCDEFEDRHRTSVLARLQIPHLKARYEALARDGRLRQQLRAEVARAGKATAIPIVDRSHINSDDVDKDVAAALQAGGAAHNLPLPPGLAHCSRRFRPPAGIAPDGVVKARQRATVLDPDHPDTRRAKASLVHHRQMLLHRYGSGQDSANSSLRHVARAHAENMEVYSKSEAALRERAHRVQWEAAFRQQQQQLTQPSPSRPAMPTPVPMSMSGAPQLPMGPWAVPALSMQPQPQSATAPPSLRVHPPGGMATVPEAPRAAEDDNAYSPTNTTAPRVEPVNPYADTPIIGLFNPFEDENFRGLFAQPPPPQQQQQRAVRRPGLAADLPDLRFWSLDGDENDGAAIWNPSAEQIAGRFPLPKSDSDSDGSGSGSDKAAEVKAEAEAESRSEKRDSVAGPQTRAAAVVEPEAAAAAAAAVVSTATTPRLSSSSSSSSSSYSSPPRLPSPPPLPRRSTARRYTQRSLVPPPLGLPDRSALAAAAGTKQRTRAPKQQQQQRQQSTATACPKPSQLSATPLASASASAAVPIPPPLQPRRAQMNNFPSFLEGGPGGPGGPMNTPTGLARQGPSPGGAGGMHGGGGPVGAGGMGQANGAGGAGGAGMPNLVNGLLSGGHQTDMNHLWQVVQQLSDVLAENRSQTANIMGQVQQMQNRGILDSSSGAAAPPPTATADNANPSGPTPTTSTNTNGELPSLPPYLQPQFQQQQQQHQHATELHTLRTQLATTTTRLQALESQNASLHALLSDYETSLTLTLEKLRPFAYRHAEALLALHAHYNALLDRERQANLALRLEHQEWQAGLGRVAGLARAALKEGVDGGLGWERRERELRAENRVLRRLVGWEVSGEESEEEEGEEGL